MAHPDSAALREIADKLDQASAQGIKIGCINLIFSEVPKDSHHRLIKLMGMTCRDVSKVDICGTVADAKFGSLKVSIFAWLRDICVPRKVMKEVTVYDCDCADEAAAS